MTKKVIEKSFHKLLLGFERPFFCFWLSPKEGLKQLPGELGEADVGEDGRKSNVTQKIPIKFDSKPMEAVGFCSLKLQKQPGSGPNTSPHWNESPADRVPGPFWSEPELSGSSATSSVNTGGPSRSSRYQTGLSSRRFLP